MARCRSLRILQLRAWPAAQRIEVDLGEEKMRPLHCFDFEMVDLNHVQKMKAAFFLHIAADYGSHFGSSFF